MDDTVALKWFNMIRVSPSYPKDSWPQAECASAFETLFQPILAELPPLYWVVWNYESGPFDSLAMQYFDQEWLDQLFVPVQNDERDGAWLNFSLLRPGYLPALSPYIFFDWVDMLGVSGDEGDAQKVAERLAALEWSRRGPSRDLLDEEYKAQKVALVKSEGEVFLHCHDGSWWELSLRNIQSEIETMQYLRKVVGLQVDSVDL